MARFNDRHGYQGVELRALVYGNSVKELLIAMQAAKDALISYQYGNSSPELAEEIVQHMDKVVQTFEGKL